MPYYRKHGKILTPITKEEFDTGMRTGKFCKLEHRAYTVLIYYTGVRRAEALRALREQFRINNRDELVFEVLKRLKHGIQTPPLNLPMSSPFMDELWNTIDATKKSKRVFKFCPMTAYNIFMRSGFKYPHWFRLSRITWLFEQGFTIAQVKSWTGLSLNALNYYIGLVDIQKITEALKKKEVAE